MHSGDVLKFPSQINKFSLYVLTYMIYYKERKITYFPHNSFKIFFNSNGFWSSMLEDAVHIHALLSTLLGNLLQFTQ